MPQIPIAYRIARTQVDSFGSTETQRQSRHAALDCLNCDAFLQLGIDAFLWLQRADEAYRAAVYAGAVEYDGEVDKLIERLHRDWLGTCEFATRWCDDQLARGFTLATLNSFRQCECEVRGIVNSLDEQELPSAMQTLKDKAIADQRDGQTAEFV